MGGTKVARKLADMRAPMVSEGWLKRTVAADFTRGTGQEL